MAAQFGHVLDVGSQHDHGAMPAQRALTSLLGDRPLAAFVIRQVLVKQLPAQLPLDRLGNERGELPLAYPRPDRLGGPLRERQAGPSPML